MPKIKIIQSIPFFIFSLLLFTSNFVLAENFEKDLELTPSSVYFSTETPIVNSSLRIYATVKNNSASDLSGTVKFYDEKMKLQVGTDQPISVLAGGSDDVFVDFQVKGYGDHPIAVRVYPWAMEEDNPSNNKVTKSIFVDYDTDGDGTPNRQDIDDDNDGCRDNVDDLPYDSSDCLDTDGDKIGNKLDPDDDNDELLDIEEIEKGTDVLLYDTDGDGVNDKEDDYPLDSKRTKDRDGDGISDEDDLDDDNDGCEDTVDLFPLDASECKDIDKDGIGDNQDLDDDNDGLTDSEEVNILGTDPTLYDTDGDGMNDKEDFFPLDANETKDTDNDGLGDNADPNDANQGPLVKVIVNSTKVKVGDEVIFNASLSEDKDGEILSYNWDFGNGILKTGAKVNHIFQKTGDYKVKVIVTDNAQESRTKEITISVSPNWLYLKILLLLISCILLLLIVKRFFKQEKK